MQTSCFKVGGRSVPLGHATPLYVASLPSSSSLEKAAKNATAGSFLEGVMNVSKDEAVKKAVSYRVTYALGESPKKDKSKGSAASGDKKKKARKGWTGAESIPSRLIKTIAGRH